MDTNPSRIGHVIDEFLSALRSGNSPNVADFVARYPDLGSELREMLDLVHAMEGGEAISPDTLAEHNSPQDWSFMVSPSVANPMAATDATSSRPAMPLSPTRPPSKTTDVPLRRTLGKFELIAKVGEGGFGEVWKAWDTQLGRIVAIKLLKRHLSHDVAVLERFLREARAVGQLRHPGIVPVFEVANFNGTPAIISGFVEGLTLRELMKHRRIEFDEIAVLMSDVASAIDYAHSMNLIHRDIKPANIMVEYGAGQDRDTKISPTSTVAASSHDSSLRFRASGQLHPSELVPAPRPRVLDFGLALRSDNEATMTIDGQVLGTPGYMSPEQARGDGHRADCRSDIYSLGVVMYELLCGEPPFSGSNVSIIHQVIYDEPRKPREIRSDIPIDLETICLKAMARLPSQRYSTARDLSADLLRWLSDEPIEARPPTALEQFRRWFRRHPALAGSVVAVFVMMLIFTNVALVYAFNYQRLAQKADQALIKQTEALLLSQTTLQHMYTSFGNQAEKNGQPLQGAPWFVKALEQTKQLTSTQTADATVQSADKPYWLQLQNCSISSARPVRAWWQGGARLDGSNEVSNLYWHPNHRWLIIHCDIHVATIWDLLTDQHLNFGDLSQARWTPDGQSLLAVSRDGRIELRTVGSWEITSSGHCAHEVRATAWLHDPNMLVLSGPDCFSLFRLEDLQPVQTIDCPQADVSLHVHPRGDWLAVPCLDNVLRIFQRDRASGLFAPYFETKSTYSVMRRHTDAAFLGDDQLVFHTADRSVGKLRLSEKRIETLPYLNADSLSVSPSGRHSFLNAGFIAHVVDNAHWRQLGEVIKHKNHVMAIAFSHDERRLATASGDRTVGLFETQSGRRTMPWIQHQHDLRAVSWSPDMRYIASAQLDGMVRVWDVQNPYQLVNTGPGDQFLEISQDDKAFLPGKWESHRNRRTLRIYDIETLQPSSARFSIAGSIDGAYFSPDRSTVAIAFDSYPGERDVSKLIAWQGYPPPNPPVNTEVVENQVCFWTPQTNEVSEPLPIGAMVIGGGWSPDGRLVAFVNYKGQISIIDARSRRVVKSLDQADDFAPHFVTRGQIRFSPDGQTLSVWTMLRTSVWRTDNWELLTDYRIAPPGAQHFTHQVIYSHDSRYLAICTSALRVTVLDLKEAKVVAELPHPDWIFNAVFSPNDQTLLTTCRDGLVRVWDWRAGVLTLPPLSHQDEVWGVDISADGQWIVTGGRDSMVRFWNAQTGKPMTPAIGMNFWVLDVKFANDDRVVLASGKAPEVAVFDCERLLEPAKALQSWSTTSLTAYAELLSAQRLVGDELTNLTSAQWMDVWNSHVQEKGLPKFSPLPLPYNR